VGRAATWTFAWPVLTLSPIAALAAAWGVFDGTLGTSWHVTSVALIPVLLMAGWLAWGAQRWRRASEAAFRTGLGGGSQRAA